LEFSTLVLTPRDEFTPFSSQQAACELALILPDDFERRLVASRDELSQFADAPSDPAVSERILDLAIYLDELWGSEWSSDPDPMSRLAKVVNAIPLTDCEK
jgi:hypothetical protein